MQQKPRTILFFFHAQQLLYSLFSLPSISSKVAAKKGAVHGAHAVTDPLKACRRQSFLKFSQIFKANLQLYWSVQVQICFGIIPN